MKSIFTIVLLMILHPALKADNMKLFLYPRAHSLSILSNSDATTALYLYHTNGFDSSGNVLSQLIFSASSSKLRIMENSNWLRYDIKANKDDVRLINKVKTSSYGYKNRYKSSGQWFKKPSEAWLKEETNYSIGYSNWKSKSKFTNIVGRDGVKYYCLEVIFYKNSAYQYTLYFGSGVGLIRYKDKNGEVLNNDLYFEKLASTFKNSYSSTETLRKAFYKQYSKARNVSKDTVNIRDYQAQRHDNISYQLDTLTAMSMALRSKNSSFESYTKYLITSVLTAEMDRLSVVKPRSKGINEYMEYFANWSLYLAPKYNSLSSSYAKKYLKNPDKDWKQNYLKSLEIAGKARFYLLTTKKYSMVDARDAIGYGEQYIRTGLSKKAGNNENNYNFTAYAYYKIGNKNLDFYYNALAAEQFLMMSEKEKALNVKYVESTMRDLMRKTTTNEEQYTKAIGIIANYKIKGNALQKARNGYNQQGFNSVNYMFTYGDVALADSSKVNVAIVVDELESKETEFTTVQNKKLISYYKFLGMKDKANKLSKAVNKQEKKKSTNNKRSSKGGGFPFGLAFSTNPANLLWNTFPLAADLRIGGTIHQFRINTHTERTTKSMFGNNAVLQDVDDNLKKEWLIKSARDYSYSLLFRAPDNIVIGLQLGYGNLNLNPEVVQVKNEISAAVSNINVDPTITRYSGAMQWGWRFSSRRHHYYFGAYYLLGVGYRTMDYGYNGNLEINDKDQFSFAENASSYGFRHNNWNKFYGILNYRIRIGLTLF
jgi:hypothetical protein